LCFFFFFSSRRRHTRWPRDWSSDVCSSDLEMTQVALATRQHANMPELNDQARKKFLYRLSRADYEKEFGAKYRRPGIFARILAFFLRVIPRFGPFKPLAYRDPTPQTEDLYFRSMNDVVDNYSRMVNE